MVRRWGGETSVAALLSLHVFAQRPGGADATDVAKPADGTKFIPFSDDRHCDGQIKELGECEGLPPCNNCEPVDCVFHEWSTWTYNGGCSGIMIRSREYKRMNNVCGEPCDGAKTESMLGGLPDRCIVEKKDCELGNWSEWSKCFLGPTDQRVRVRSIVTFPENGGMECAGALTETKPCGEEKPTACEFQEWTAYTPCSKTCGGGYHMKTRRVMKEATYGGATCEGALQVSDECNTDNCGEDTDCLLGPWVAWSACGYGKRQKYRTREVAQSKLGAGKPCVGKLAQTQECPAEKGDDPCEVSDWNQWSTCTKTCDNGQMHRSRNVKAEGTTSICKSQPLQEITSCSTQPCDTTSDCELNEWADWDACSVTCGEGTMLRKRIVMKIATEMGQGCNCALDQVKACHTEECEKQDCAWGEWHRWSACSATCGGGSRHRDRYVEVAPLGGGKLCEPLDKEELDACNTQRCGDCVDGSFLEWSPWSTCSSTCDEGFQTRQRDIGTHPNTCGKGLSGLTDEYKVCKTGVLCIPDVDCVLDEWTEWGDCSSSCNGVTERNRVIKEFSSGKGKGCALQAAKENKACHSNTVDSQNGGVALDPCGKPEPKQCLMGDWYAWSGCSAPCDGGQRHREREIKTPAQIGGMPCNDTLTETEECNTESCDPEAPMDCSWGEWESWGDCTKCGNQRFRHRLIKQMANSAGKNCVPEDSKQMGSCHSDCYKENFCVLSEWTQFGKCSAECGPSMKTRSRMLTMATETPESGQWLFKASGDAMACGGSQIEVSPCALKECSPCITVEGKMGEWSEWTQPSCTQLCERSRRVAVEGECDGKMATGPLVVTKACPHVCTEPVDCIMGTWEDWSLCTTTTTQRTRDRSVLRMSANGGVSCEGALKETGNCTTKAATAVTCAFRSWSPWSQCTKSCGDGFHSRERLVKNAASHGGAGCLGDLKEVEPCNTESCPEHCDCVLSPWEAWTTCDGSQTSRMRDVLKEVSGGGLPCNVSLREVRGCSVEEPCEASAWSAWDDCDKTCDGGQKMRQRQILKLPSQGGTKCPEALMETNGCNKEPCDHAPVCKLHEWSKWSTCTATCGHGQQNRKREMAVDAIGCADSLEETRACEDIMPCEVKECLWHDWADWSACTCSCAGGQRSRDRHIKQVPDPGMPPCPLSAKEEMEPCNTHSCEKVCVGGAWAAWTKWTACSSNCSGGITFRTRKVKREANECGTPATGESDETMSCNSDVPCVQAVDGEFNQWSDWSGCTRPCDGLKQRSRTIKTHALGEGKHCEGATKQTYPCNPGSLVPGMNVRLKLLDECKDVAVVDCEVSEWKAWGKCSASCGGGQAMRSREIMRMPSNGGKGCGDAMSEVKGCNTDPCAPAVLISNCVPKDCAWGEWEEWGACDKCGGQKRRFRQLISLGVCGGKMCVPINAKETAGCTRHCEAPTTFCGWSEWSPWGQCDSKCGLGSRERTRELLKHSEERFLSDWSVDDVTEEAVNDLRLRTQGLEASHYRTLVVSFAGGGVALVAVLLAFRVSTRSASHAGAMPLAQVEEVAVE